MIDRRSLLAAGAGLLAERRRPAKASADAPDIVVIVTDDMRASDWRALPRTRALVGGTRFADFVLTTPQCGPSRATLLTGRYAHTHGVLKNGPPDGGWASFRRHEGATVATALQAAGYRTGLFGKYLNGFPAGGDPPPGWQAWHGAAEAAYGTPAGYGTDLIAEQAARFVRSTAPDRPLFAWIAPKAPHAPPEPAPRHAGRFPNARVPRTAALNEADVSDKPAYLQHDPPRLPDMDRQHRDRLRTLLSVDDLVSEVAAAMGDRWERACVVVVSDNGFALGEHRWVGKNTPHDESVRVPLLIRCPGLAPGDDARLAASIDIAPTIAAVAGVALPDADGRSLLDAWDRDRVLIESWSGAAGAPYKGVWQAPPFAALRSRAALYAEYGSGERERYDLAADPLQLDNLAADGSGAGDLPAQLDELRRCTGAACRTADGG